MIIWITGRRNSGKTTLAKSLSHCNGAYHIDGDILREETGNSDFTKEGRWASNMKAASIAKRKEEQGMAVVISTICPYIELRKELQSILDCNFIYLSGGDMDCVYEDEPNATLWRAGD